MSYMIPLLLVLQPWDGPFPGAALPQEDQQPGGEGGTEESGGGAAAGRAKQHPVHIGD